MKAILNISRYSFRQRWQLLCWSVVPLLLLCYWLAFSGTISLITACRQIEGRLRAEAMGEGERRLLGRKREAAAGWKQQYMVDSARLDEPILSSVNQQCDSLGLELKEYKPLGVGEHGVWTRQVTIKGGFGALLQLVFGMEQEERRCRLAAVRLLQMKDDQQESLHGIIYIQNILDAP